jgi:hypothetical protein
MRSQLGAYTLIVRHTVRKNEMGGFIALYVTACLNLANPGSCVTEFITDSTQNQMSMTECLGVEGLNSAKEFVEKHPLYHTWQFRGWSCQIGNKPAPKRGEGMSLQSRAWKNP